MRFVHNEFSFYWIRSCVCVRAELHCTVFVPVFSLVWLSRLHLSVRIRAHHVIFVSLPNQPIVNKWMYGIGEQVNEEINRIETMRFFFVFQTQRMHKKKQQLLNSFHFSPWSNEVYNHFICTFSRNVHAWQNATFINLSNIFFCSFHKFSSFVNLILLSYLRCMVVSIVRAIAFFPFYLLSNACVSESCACGCGWGHTHTHTLPFASVTNWL